MWIMSNILCILTFHIFYPIFLPDGLMLTGMGKNNYFTVTKRICVIDDDATKMG